MASLLANRNFPNNTGWQDRHDRAVQYPRGYEACLVDMLMAWKRYAEIHCRKYESPIGDDGVLGDGWADIGRGIRVLLNGEIGRLDAGTLDTFIADTMREHEVDPDA